MYVCLGFFFFFTNTYTYCIKQKYKVLKKFGQYIKSGDKTQKKKTSHFHDKDNNSMLKVKRCILFKKAPEALTEFCLHKVSPDSIFISAHIGMIIKVTDES